MKLKDVNAALLRTKLPSEMGRRATELVISGMKAEEFRGFAIIYFPILMQYFEDARDKKIWAYFSFLARAYSLPDDQYNLPWPR